MDAFCVDASVVACCSMRVTCVCEVVAARAFLDARGCLSLRRWWRARVRSRTCGALKACMRSRYAFAPR
eukprot:15485432-Alexandrium_andersonii.AAC.1